LDYFSSTDSEADWNGDSLLEIGAIVTIADNDFTVEISSFGSINDKVACSIIIR